MGSPAKGQPPTTTRHIASKGHSTPTWATLDNLIGYTFKHALTARDVNNKMNEAIAYYNKTKSNQTKHPAWNRNEYLNLKPSVYYKQGHATLQHPRLENLGWTKSNDWIWTFFGTVPHDKAKIIHEPSDPRTQSPPPGSTGSSAGTTHAWRANYGDELMDKYGSFCWSDSSRTRTKWSHGKLVGKSWLAFRFEAPTPEPTLLEIWKTKGGTFHGHDSRNAFFWVADKALKASLHDFAVKWFDEIF